MSSSHPARRAFELFEQALDLPPDQRAAFVRNACAGDEALQEHLDALLAADAAVTDVDPLPAAFPSSVAASLVGQQIGPYSLTAEIGAGGMGTVYLARRDDLDTEVALKIIRDGRLATPDAHQRFLFERRVLARLQHPHIARLLDAGVTEDGRPYFALEYVEGMPITDYCRTHRLSVDERLALFLQVCEAVQYAHQNLIVHRDLKPSNVLVSREGQVALLDFGIAKLLESSDDPAEALTGTGMRLMTPAYASPEQVRGETVSTASDVYALGVLLYELLAGRHPYPVTGRSLQDIERMVCEQAPERPSAAAARARQPGSDRLRRQLDGDLDTIVLMALRKEPERRYASAEQLLDDIRRYLHRLPVKARHDTTGYRLQKFVQRHRIGVATAAGLALLLLGFSLRERGLRAEAEQARDEARLEARKAERVAGFLADLFREADPDVAQGRDVTVREIMDRGAQQVATALDDDPEIQATLMTVLGRAYQKLGHYAAAETQLEGALQRRQAVWTGTLHADVSASLTNLGALKRQQGDYAAADSLYRQALAVDRALYGDVHPAIARNLNNRAELLAAQGDAAGAERLYDEALALYETILQRDQPLDQPGDLIKTANNLAMLYLEQGELDLAETVLRDVLATAQRALGDDVHPITVTVLYNQAIVLLRKGDYEAAEPLLHEVLDLQRSLYGPAHPLIAKTLDGLASAQYLQGNYAETERLLSQAYSMKLEFFAPDHPDVRESLDALVVVYDLLGRTEDAAFYRGLRTL